MKRTPFKRKTTKTCAYSECSEEFKLHKTTDKYCSYACKEADLGKEEAQPKLKRTGELKRSPLNNVSKRRSKEQPVYKKRRLAFLRANKVCEIKGPTCTHTATTIEHTRGRQGYADEQAREQGLTLYLDERYWKASCWACNMRLENDSDLSEEHQLSKIHGGKKLIKK